MIHVTELGYMGIGVKDLDTWKHFAANIIGWEIVDEGEDDRCYARLDYWHHRIVLHDDPATICVTWGSGLPGPKSSGRCNSSCPRRVSPTVWDRRRGRRAARAGGLELADPNGNPVEIFHGPQVQFSQPFYPGRRMHGRFKTGAGGLGHCIVGQQDTDAAYRFYRALACAAAWNTRFSGASRSSRHFYALQ